MLWLPSYSPPSSSSPIPSQPLRDDADEKGGDHATHGKDGHGERPEGGEGAWGDGTWSLRPLPAQPRLIVALLNHLGEQQRNESQQTLPSLLTTAVLCPPCLGTPTLLATSPLPSEGH